MAQLPRGLCSTLGFQCCLLFLLASWEAVLDTNEALRHSEPGRVEPRPGDGGVAEFQLLASRQRGPDLERRAHRGDLQGPTRWSPQGSEGLGVSTLGRPAVAVAAAIPGRGGVQGPRESPPQLGPAGGRGRAAALLGGAAGEAGSGSTVSRAASRREGAPGKRSPRRTEHGLSAIFTIFLSHPYFYGGLCPLAPILRLSGESRPCLRRSHWPHCSASRNQTSRPLQIHGNPEAKAPLQQHTPFQADSQAEHGGQTVVAHEVTGAHTTPPEHGGQTVVVHEVTGAHTEPSEHGGQTVAAHEVTGAHSEPPEHGGQTMAAHEVTGAHTTPPEHGGPTTVVHEVTGAHTEPPERGGQTTLTQEGTEETTEAQTMSLDHGEKTTSAHKKTISKSTERPEETTSTTEKTASISKNSVEYPKTTTLTTETTKTFIQSIKIPEKTAEAPLTAETTRHTAKATADKSVPVTSPHVKKTGVTHLGPLGSLLPTPSGAHQSPTTSGAPDNKSHPQQTGGHSQTGPHAAATGTQGSFPAWAIVVVVLLAVILLLLFIGLILVSCLSAARHRALARNTEDIDLQDQEGPNSYPVYLMEQQNLGRGQVPFPQ
ncbi:diffuse panbronchiolitis critical region protein 1 [Octodon degus]|uniref:Diffuse panbronchiolitis critical region protein 1 n=1 Tax=Octodon degus TaxID=10160 RepID=A0A6P6F0Q5_OCTDE|nr:diffuse panbronchiolitis critical region protein 1 [Octodon degus]